MFAVNTAPIPWISGELELFSEFFSLGHFCRLGIPFKATTPKTFFFSCSDVTFLYSDIEIQKNHFLCVPDVTPGTGGWNRVAFFGHCSPAQGGKVGDKNIPFSGGEAGSELILTAQPVFLLGPVRGKKCFTFRHQQMQEEIPAPAAL